MWWIWKLVQGRLLIRGGHLHLAGHASIASGNSASDRRRTERQRDSEPNNKRRPEHTCCRPEPIEADAVVRCHGSKVGASILVAKPASGRMR